MNIASKKILPNNVRFYMPQNLMIRRKAMLAYMPATTSSITTP
jgi:hypothetical protein